MLHVPPDVKTSLRHEAVDRNMSISDIVVEALINRFVLIRKEGKS